MKFYYILIFAFLANCKSVSTLNSSYGIRFNEARKEVGLPILPEDWKISVSNSRLIVWEPIKKENNGFPYYSHKKVVLDTLLNIKYEENRFIGFGMHRNLDGNFVDELYITYRFYDNSWQCNLSDKSHPEGIKLNRVEADSLLVLWGIK